MSFAVPGTGTTSTAYGATTTAQNIVDATSQDIRKVLSNSGADAAILLDYVDRVQKRILRNQNHPFLLSGAQRFYTQEGITSYWLGLTASLPVGLYDTALNLSDLRQIKDGEVWDRTNTKILARRTVPPMGPDLCYPDGTYRLGYPEEWHQDPLYPYQLDIYPAANNQTITQPQPVGGLVTSTSGGALALRTYFIRTSFVDSLGNESNAYSPATRYTVAASQLLKVRTPVINPSSNPAAVGYSSYKVYVGTTEGSEYYQATVTTGSDWTEPNGGVTLSGTIAPSSNAIEPIRGYLIEFRYYKTRNSVTSLSDVLQIPDIYKDIIVAGTNWYAFKYLKKDDEAQIWYSMFQDGLRQITKDTNLLKVDVDYIRPGTYAQYSTY